MMIESSGGVSVALHDLGGDGPALLLAHATGFHGKVWGPVARYLPDAHCFAPDLRGHGDATVPDNLTYEWDGFADDVLAIVDSLGAGTLIAAGHSKGGAALLLAEQRRPATFRAIYCFEPIVIPRLEPLKGQANPLADGALKRRDTFESFDAAYENFASKPPFDALDPDALRAYVDFGFAQQDDGSVRLKCRPSVESQVYRMGSQHGAFARLNEVRCPVTVAVGIEMARGPSAFAEPIVEALPNATLERHPQLGHFGPLEDPKTIAQSIRRALLE